MSQPTLVPAREIDWTAPPCQRCLGLSIGGKVWPDMVMPLPQGDAVAPLARDGSGPCCFDCAAADGLFRAVLQGKHAHLGEASTFDQTWFTMARVAVGNDRLEQERLPGIPMGLVYYGLVAPSQPGDLEQHHAWLASLGLFQDPWDDDV